VTSLWLLSLKNDVNVPVPSKSTIISNKLRKEKRKEQNPELDPDPLIGDANPDRYQNFTDTEH
jgi:hypothetical protein